jgi:hypothetical protein
MLCSYCSRLFILIYNVMFIEQNNYIKHSERRYMPLFLKMQIVTMPHYRVESVFIGT